MWISSTKFELDRSTNNGDLLSIRQESLKTHTERLNLILSDNRSLLLVK